MPVKRAPVKRRAPKKVVHRKKRVYRSRVARGRGDYVVNDNDSYGKQIGGKLGSYAGEFLGGAAQNLLTNLAISGFGDYKVRHNSLLAPEPPTIINDSVKGGITFRHKEYLRDIITAPVAGAFNLDSYLINPGNEKTFGWLSQVAANFEQYSLEGIIFEYRSMSADALNSTNTALGSVIMATNYDAVDVNFKSKSEMENYEWGMSCKPSVNMLHPIECAPRQSFASELYILNGPVPTGSDPRIYHWGNMQIATTGFQGTNVNIGELWVTYQVRLLKPKLYTALGKEIGDFVSVNTAYTNALPIGSGTASVLYDTIGVIVDPPNRNIGLPINGSRKHYQIDILWVGSLVAWQPPTPTFTDCVVTSYRQTSCPAGGESCTVGTFSTTIMVEANKFGVLTLATTGTLPTAGSNVRIYVAELNPFNY